MSIGFVPYAFDIDIVLCFRTCFGVCILSDVFGVALLISLVDCTKPKAISVAFSRMDFARFL